MDKLLSIQEAWDTLEDDQRQFERMVAELKAKVSSTSTNQKSNDKPSEGQDPSQNVTKKKGWFDILIRLVGWANNGILESRHKYGPGG